MSQIGTIEASMAAAATSNDRHDGAGAVLSSDCGGNDTTKSALGAEKENVDPQRPRKRKQTAMRDCPICLMRWKANGPHRIVSLHCGHLFGRRCILRWLKEKGKCPNCKRTAKKADIRPIFVAKIIAEEDNGREAALRAAASEKHRREKAEMLRAKAQLEAQSLRQELHEVHKQLSSAKSEVRRLRMVYAPSNSGEFAGPGPARQNDERGLQSSDDIVLKDIHSIPTRSSRVFCFSSVGEATYLTGPIYQTQAMATSCSSFGIQKVSLQDPRHTQSIAIHSKTIRDIKCGIGNHDNLVLSTGYDSTLKVTDIRSNSAVTSFALQSPGWSCEWDIQNSYVAYVGTSSGKVKVFDMRKPDSALAFLLEPGSKPIHSLTSLEPNVVGSFFTGTSLLVGSTSGVCVAGNSCIGTATDSVTDYLFKGPCINTGYDRKKKLVWVSSRSSCGVGSFVNLSSLSVDESLNNPLLQLKPIAQFSRHRNPPTLARMASFYATEQFVVLGNAKTNNAQLLRMELHEGRTVTLKPISETQPHTSPIVDIQAYVRDGSCVVGVLSSNKLSLYRCHPTTH